MSKLANLQTAIETVLQTAIIDTGICDQLISRRFRSVGEVEDIYNEGAESGRFKDTVCMLSYPSTEIYSQGTGQETNQQCRLDTTLTYYVAYIAADRDGEADRFTRWCEWRDAITDALAGVQLAAGSTGSVLDTIDSFQLVRHDTNDANQPVDAAVIEFYFTLRQVTNN